jgi:hypothetical protein
MPDLLCIVNALPAHGSCLVKERTDKFEYQDIRVPLAAVCCSTVQAYNLNIFHHQCPMAGASDIVEQRILGSSHVECTTVRLFQVIPTVAVM